MTLIQIIFDSALLRLAW